VETQERILFELLLEKVSKKLQENHPEVNMPMQEWKGDEIAILREDLQEKVQGTISEKWFYTHVKNQQDKLPRIDTLNLFCQYINATSWNAFAHQHSENTVAAKINSTPTKPIQKPSPTKSRKMLPIVFAVILGVIGLVYYFTASKPVVTQYKFCFIDQNTHLPVVDSFLEIKVIKGEETPMFFPLKSSCMEGVGKEVDFIIKGRFYKSLHIKRTITNDTYEESIFLEPDDYAMMLHLFVNSKVDDWKKRRKQMGEIMHDNLKAYEISKDGFTIDVLTKDEFINKMTLPTRVLKQVAIVHTDYEGDKISMIKFTQE
jgi:hypothetical protein